MRRTPSTTRQAERAFDRVRAACLSLPETTEAPSWGHPNFRAGKRTFVACEWIDDRPSIAFKVGATDADLLLRRDGFWATPYGQRQWVSVWADRRIDWRMVHHLIDRSYRGVALKRMVAALDGAGAPPRRTR